MLVSTRVVVVCMLFVSSFSCCVNGEKQQESSPFIPGSDGSKPTNQNFQQPGRPPKAHELTLDYTFEQYIIDFQKPYENTMKEYIKRKSTFQQNLQMIWIHNQNVMYDLGTGIYIKNVQSGHNYHLGVNQFMDMTASEIKSYYFGYSKAMHESYKPSIVSSQSSMTLATAMKRKNQDISTLRRKRKVLSTVKTQNDNPYEMDLPFNITSVSTLPKSIQYTNQTTPIKNQGHCGSCWSFSSIAALEDHLAIHTGSLNVLSTQELVSCVDNPSHCGGNGGCTGATAELAYEYIARNGVLTEPSFPYRANDTITCPLENRNVHFNKDKAKDKNIIAKIQGYARIPTNNYTALMNAVAKHGPVVIAAAASSWAFYEGGVYSPADVTNPNVWDLNHGIVVEGYGK